MVPREETLDVNNSIKSESTTESSDSYSYLLRDVENPNNHINEEWEAIERTLYQESGKHVTDPALLKECKLWRETFPHIRVRGTAIKAEQEEGVGVTKSVEAVDKNHISLSKINEKREKIKKTVVSHIVERLINKLNINKENSVVSREVNESDEVSKEGTELNGNAKSCGTQSEKESYFERGKKIDTRGKVTKFPDEESVPPAIASLDKTGDNSDDSERNFSTDYLKPGNKARLWSGYCYNDEGRTYTSNLAKNEDILRSGNIMFKIAEKNPSTLVKRENSLSSVIKPFEMTKKIDKKYESMLERILENKGFGGSIAKTNPKRHAYEEESMDNLHGKHTRGDFSYRKSKQFPKLNNFTNNWINRAEQHSHDPYGINPRSLLNVAQTDIIKGRGKSSKFQLSRSANQCEEKFLEEIRREMGDYTASLRREFEEEINLRRPQIHNKYNKNYTARTQKSSSCSDLPKKNPKSCNRTFKGGLEKGKSELTVRNATKKTGKIAGNQNVQLPPIETSIICTEIVGRPKVASRTLPKKYI